MIEGLEIESIDTGLEKKIAIGCIVSDEFLRDVSPIFRPDYIRNNYLRKVIRWCIEFYEGQRGAPKGSIEDVFLVEKEGMDEEETEFIEELLVGLSERYEEEGGFNARYVLNEIVVPYFRKRRLEIMKGKVEVLLGKGMLDRAEREVEEFSRDNVSLGDPARNPFSEEAVREVHSEERGFFRMPGGLGEFLGDFYRGFLISFMGAFKRGKTWMLEEVAVRGMFRRLNCAFFSLEMSERKMYERFQRRVVPAKGEGGWFVYPCFDCERNQFGTCKRKERSCGVRLRDDRGEKPRKPQTKSDIPAGYKPCTYCRGTDLYVPDYWFEFIKQPAFDMRVMRRIRRIDEKWGRFIKQVAFPRFSASVGDIRRCLDTWDKQGWVVDVIVVDYADILKPEPGSPSVGYEKHDQTWMSLAGLAGERNALVVTATQVNAKGQGADTLSTEHSSQWVGKNAHVDGMFSLNQTAAEKEVGIMRVGIDQHRHKNFSKKSVCTILQQIDLAQPLLDSMVLKNKLVVKEEDVDNGDD